MAASIRGVRPNYIKGVIGMTRKEDSYDVFGIDIHVGLVVPRGVILEKDANYIVLVVMRAYMKQCGVLFSVNGLFEFVHVVEVLELFDQFPYSFDIVFLHRLLKLTPSFLQIKWLLLLN